MSRVCVFYDSNNFHVRYSALNTLSTRLAQILGTPEYARLRDIAAETCPKRVRNERLTFVNKRCAI